MVDVVGAYHRTWESHDLNREELNDTSELHTPRCSVNKACLTEYAHYEGCMFYKKRYGMNSKSVFCSHSKTMKFIKVSLIPITQIFRLRYHPRRRRPLHHACGGQRAPSSSCGAQSLMKRLANALDVCCKEVDSNSPVSFFFFSTTILLPMASNLSSSSSPFWSRRGPEP